MKNYKKITLLISIFIVCFACKDDANREVEISTLELSRDEVKLSFEESSTTIQITSNGSWTAKVEDNVEWLSVSPSEGNGNGNIRIFTKENSGSEPRNGKVLFVQTDNKSVIEKSISVEQLGSNPDILLAYSSEKIAVEGGVFEISVVANIKWEIIIDEEYDWITLLETGDDFCKVQIDRNVDVERVGQVSVKSIGLFSITKTAEFVQEAADAKLSVKHDEFIVPYKNQTVYIPVDLGGLNTQYKISSNEDWIVWNESKSTVDRIALDLADNNSSDFPRVADVVITNVHLQERVQIFQYGRPNPRIGDDISSDVLAFPGAEGGGRFTTGGRGGKIYRVTSLDDNEPGTATKKGTFRWAVERNGDRIVIFDVSGTVELKSGIKIGSGNISIIGQTAPGDGITLKNHDITVASNNVLVRFIRIRPGDQKGEEVDAISGRWFSTGIVDHVSGSWGVDECISFYGVKDFTLQWSIASESLNNSVHAKGAHGYGAMFSGDNASCHHFLLAHHSSRMPRVSALSENLQPSNPNDNQGFSDMRNIVAYNWYGGGLGAYGGEHNPFNWVNHYYKAGPATGSNYKSWRLVAASPTSRIYADGSVAPANPKTASDNWNYGIWDQMTATQAEKEAMKMSEPHPYSKVTTHSAVDAYDRVTKYAGASLRRDEVDKRLIEEILAGTFTYRGSVSGFAGIVDNISDLGGANGAYPELKSLPALIDTDDDGIPDIWEDAYGLDKNNPADAMNYDLDDLGRYSNLEVYFHNLVQHIIYEQNLGGEQSEKK